MEDCTVESDVHCTVHPNKIVHLYCTDCEKLVCLTCVTKQHQRHNFVEISDIVEEKKKSFYSNLSQQITELEGVLENLYIHQQEYVSKVNLCETKVRGQGQRLKIEIDKLVEQFISELRQKEIQCKESIKRKELEINKTLEDLKQLKDGSEDKMMSKNCVHIIMYVDQMSDNTKRYKSYRSPVQTLPSFPNTSTSNKMLKYILGIPEYENSTSERVNDLEEVSICEGNSRGDMTKEEPLFRTKDNLDDISQEVSSLNDSKQNDIVNAKNKYPDSDEKVKVASYTTNSPDIHDSPDSDVQGRIKDNTASLEQERIRVTEAKHETMDAYGVHRSVQEVKVANGTITQQDSVKKLDNKTKIISKFIHSKKVDHIAAVDSTLAWIAGSGYLELVKQDGQPVKSIKLDFPVRGMAMTKDGELLLGTEGKIKKLLKSGEIVDFVNVGNFNANGICVLENGEILVCLYKDDVGELILRLSSQGQTIQKIKHDKNGSRLFAWPWYITETSGGDIWVSDYTEECIIVIDKTLKPRFKYNGPKNIKMDKQFYPRGMTTNRNGQVVVIDRGNEAVHLVDKDGKFVKFILSKSDGLIGPYSLSQDSEGIIWVGCASRKIVIIAKYLE